MVSFAFIRIKDFNSNWFDLIAMKEIVLNGTRSHTHTHRNKKWFSAKHTVFSLLVSSNIILAKMDFEKNCRNTHSISIRIIRCQYIACYFDFIWILCGSDGYMTLTNATITNLISFFCPIVVFFRHSITTILLRFILDFVAIFYTVA